MSTLPKDLTAAVDGFRHAVKLAQALPFDMAREQYAKAVQAGLIRRSMLDWAKFERHMHLMEQVTLGPLARRV
jgi:hypothetical protein